MDNLEIRSTIEAVLFAAGEPVPAERIALVLGTDTDEVFKCAKQLADEYSYQQRGIRLVRMGDSLQLCSSPEFAQSITRVLERRKPPKLSQSALEVLAICAYFQPVTRAYVDQVRGVDSSYTMGLLLERGLIEPCGKLDVTGRPSIYKTSELFLRTMAITNLSELPKLPDMSSGDGVAQLKSVIDALKSDETEQMEIVN
ncbi:MAG: SMC-Scp complex subunit ScpB [Clostridiales bacterium]|nr:SMC-Scp complex subunit ScpB [Clostridiales bacterium]